MQTRPNDRGMRKPVNYKKDTKVIKIPSYGRIGVLHGINGPVLQPFKCSVDTIMHLINTRVKVIEILPDGTEVELNKSNYYKDNSVVKQPEQKQEVVKEEKKQEASDKTIEEHTEEDKQETSDKNFNKNKNKNFNNNNNKQQKNK